MQKISCKHRNDKQVIFHFSPESESIVAACACLAQFRNNFGLPETFSLFTLLEDPDRKKLKARINYLRADEGLNMECLLTGPTKSGLANIRFTSRKFRKKNILECNLHLLDMAEFVMREYARTRYRYHSLLEKSSYGIVLINAQGIIEMVNPAFLELTGFTGPELLHERVEVLVPPEHQSRHQHYIDTYHQTGDSQIIGRGRVINLRTKTGEFIPVFIRVQEEVTPEETFYLATIQDISEKTMLQTRLRQAEDSFQNLAEASPAGIFLTNKTGTRLQYLNPSLRSLVPPEVTVPEELSAYLPHLHPDDRRKVIRTFLQSESPSAKNDNDIIVRIRQGESSYRWLQIRYRSFSDDYQSGFIGTVSDITPLKTAEHAILAGKNQLEDIAAALPGALVYIDRDLRYGYVNDTVCKMWNRPASDFLGRKISEVLPAKVAEELESYLVRSLQGEKLEFETEIKDAKGKVRVLKKTYIPHVVHEETLGVTCTSIDITDIKANTTALQQLQEELIRQRDKEKLENQRKSDFLTSMSHEIRTPLTGIVGMANLLEKELNTAMVIPETMKSYIHHISTSSRNLAGMINQILDLRQVEVGKMTVEPDFFQLSDLLRDLHSVLHFGARERNIQLNIVMDPDVPETFFSDRTRLLQILLNLTGNAVKYSPSGSEVAVRASGGPENLTFEVRDHGTGIPKEKQSTVFEPFERFHSGTAATGSGLGLNIAQKLSELIQGDLSFKSDERGTVFTLEVRPLPVSASAASRPPAVFRGKVRDSRAIIIEDNPVNRMVLKAMLEKFGVHVTEFESGEEAYEQCGDCTADMIFIDQYLPGMTGLQLLEKLHRKLPDLKTGFLVMASAEIYSDAMQKAQGRLFHAFLRKPFTLPDLEKLLGLS